MGFKERLTKEWLFWDGGTGSVLQSWGLQAGELPETWNINHPEKIVELNKGYLEAGCDIINTNTFGANRLKYPDNLEEIVTKAVEHAKKARELTGRGDALIALDLGPTGKLLEPLGDLSFDDAVDIYAEVIEYGTKAGADVILIETMQDSYELKAAVLAAKEHSHLPVCATVVFDEKGKMLTGGTPESVVALLEGLHIAGLPQTDDEGHTYYDMNADEFASEMKEIASLNVHVLGGCCGTTPEYLSKTIELVKDLPIEPPVKKNISVVTSFSQAVEIGPKPVIIGERINPTGKKKFKQALRDGDINYILSEGLKQEDAGAHILDVNVGLPEIDEPKMMVEVMKKLQSVIALPLQIDTSDPIALEAALRHYNGKAMINSVNGKQESMDAVFPLVKKYGGVVVGLALDEEGIPDNAADRIRIAKKIYKEASKYGIEPKDIVIDGLAMTISSDPTSAIATLETLRIIRDELHGHSILGVSNISFGLPQRPIINANFFTMAMQSGLSCAIINPSSEAMMKSYRAYLALSGLDTNFTEYISAYGNSAPAPVKSEAVDMSLYESIKRGMSENAGKATQKQLETKEGLEIINDELIPALDEVGKGFEKGTIFLPQLLMSAEAAKAAFAVIKDSMAGKPREMKGKIIIATVKGDIHDIGKNIVKVMLENYDYDVIDLGKDVPPELIVDTAIKEDVKLVGLSALMTTTVVSMEDTIKLLKEKKPDTLTVVGGAVMTQEYADRIGADCYAKDAMETVRFADKVFGGE